MDPTYGRTLDFKLAIVTLICLTGSALGAHQLYLDLNAKAGAGIGTPMAKVDRTEYKVRRKPGNSYMWANVEQSEDLYKKDSVQTGPGAAATIKLNDGSMLEIGENSLVVIDDIQALALNFKRGSLIIRKADGGDQRITVDKDGKAKVEELPIRLMRPEPLAQMFTNERALKPVKLSWEPRGKTPVEGFVIQVSPDKSFKSASTKTFTLNDAAARETDLQLAPGRYFWRVSGKGAAPSEARQFRVSTAFALRPSAPSLRNKILSWGGESSIQFRWSMPQSKFGESVEEALAYGKHELEISQDSEFRSQARTQTVAPDTLVAVLKTLPEGSYFWRLKSRYGELMVSSEAERFAVEKGKDVVLELGRPDKNMSFELRPQVQFTWDSDADNVEYLWELQDSKGATVASSRTKAKTYVWAQTQPGTFKWKVSAHWNEQKVGETVPRALSLYQGKPVSLKSPAKNQEIFYWDDPVKFSFEWTEDSLVDQEDFAYQIDVARDADFKSVAHSKKTEGESLSSRDFEGLSAGNYFWRVRVVDKSGMTIKASETAKFAYGTFPPLQAPGEAKPAAGVEYNALEEDKDPVLTWAPVDGAEGYEVVVYTTQVPVAGRSPSSATNKVVYKVTTGKTTATVKGLPEGKYHWTIRSVDRMKRAGEPMPPKWFSVTYGEVLGAPESTTPEVQ